MECAQVFLVGDPVQLPATVISSRAVQHGYDRSLFKRLQSSGFPVQASKPKLPSEAYPARTTQRVRLYAP